jgi:hypothetical protein
VASASQLAPDVVDAAPVVELGATVEVVVDVVVLDAVVVDETPSEAVFRASVVDFDTGSLDVVVDVGEVPFAIAALRVVPGISEAMATPTAVVPSAATRASEAVITRMRRATLALLNLFSCRWSR